MAENFPELLEAGLNRSKRKFCKIKENKNIRLLAPAGSGKTFSLLWRCKCIHDMRLQAGKDAPCFLIITFTRAAKYELESRIQKDEGFRGLSVTVRTLNSWGWEQMKSRSGKELVVTKFSRKGLVNHDLLSICKDYENIYKLIKTARGQSANASIIIAMPMGSLRIASIARIVQETAIDAVPYRIPKVFDRPRFKTSQGPAPILA